MSLYLPDDFQLLEASHDTSELIKLLLESISKRGPKVGSQLLVRLQDFTTRAQMNADDREFLHEVASMAQRGKSDEVSWEDLAHVLRILASVDFRLREFIANQEAPGPTPAGRARYDSLTRLLGLTEDAASRRSREKRHKRIVDVLEKRPGLYVTELYKELHSLSGFETTYATVWSDVRALEARKKLITIGGPQGTPRYCFPHPSTVRNRRAYYEGYYGAEGIVEEKLTEYFAPTKRYYDLFLVNSHTQPLILLLRFGVADKQVLGAHVKTFGRLHRFEFLQTQEGLALRGKVASHDVLRVFSLTKIQQDAEEPIWHDAEALSGLSLYSGSSAAAM